MNNIVDKTLKFALDNDRPLIICYMSGDNITQRRIYVRKIEDTGVTAYCMQKKSLRKFKKEGILSAHIAET